MPRGPSRKPSPLGGSRRRAGFGPQPILDHGHFVRNRAAPRWEQRSAQPPKRPALPATRPAKSRAPAKSVRRRAWVLVGLCDDALAALGIRQPLMPWRVAREPSEERRRLSAKYLAVRQCLLKFLHAVVRDLGVVKAQLLKSVQPLEVLKPGVRDLRFAKI